MLIILALIIFAVILFAIIYFPFRKSIHCWFAKKKYKGNRNVYAAVVIALVVVISVVVFLTTNKVAPDSGVASDEVDEEVQEESIEIGSKIPQIELPDTDGNLVNISDHTDNLLVLSFWNTWCKFCATQLPIFERLIEETDGEAEIFLINMLEPKEIVEQYKKNEKIDFDILVDADGVVSDRFEIMGTPSNFFVYDGTICATIPGAVELVDLVGTLEECKLIATTEN
ncbi:TlpA family protein disulfide reductase [Patescibacteria group bacterium]